MIALRNRHFGAAPALLAVAAGLALGCSETAELASALRDGRDSPSETPSSASPTSPADPSSTTPPSATPSSPVPVPGMPGASPGRPPGATVPVPTPPRAGACKMEVDGPKVCVTCFDSAGKVVSQDCVDRGNNPMGGSCAESRQPDGSSCVVCTDANGAVFRRGCQMPPSGCRPDPVPPVPPVPPGMPICRETDVSGLKCTVCTDPTTGREVKRFCPMPPTNPNDPITCQESSYPDGTTCVTCTDTRGNVIKQGCSRPVPPPPEPGMVTCRDYVENGARCTVCTDAQGTVVKQACSAPTPPGTMTPPPPMTGPAVSCHTFQSRTSTCVICVDDSGKIVKQDCQAPATGAGGRE
jgi:hypothetical protein